MCVRLLRLFATDMNNFVEKPNLPENNVKRVITGQLPESVRNELEKYNMEIIECEVNPLINNSLSYHADIQFIHLGKNRLLVSENQEKVLKTLDKYGFETELFSLKSGEYPYDCAVNAAFFGKNVICKFDILDDKLKKYIKDNNYNIINVNQGYSKCSVCVVNENSVITEDESVKNACIKNGIDVLLIHKGFVKLKDFEYGFIGGATFKANNNTLFFIGRVENHPDYLKIKEFLNKKRIECISLGDTELTDVGSIIPIYE